MTQGCRYRPGGLGCYSLGRVAATCGGARWALLVDLVVVGGVARHRLIDMLA
jgi:hypothetical protein